MSLCSVLTLPPSAFPSMQPWHWQRFPLAHRTGSAVFAALRDQDCAVKTGDRRCADRNPQDLNPADLSPANLSPASLNPANLSPANLSPADRRDLAHIGVLLESPYPVYEFCATAQRLSRYSICAGPPRWWGDRPLVWTPSIGDILPTLRQLRDRQAPATSTHCPTHLPFQGGWLGWLGYDLAWEIEQLPCKNADPLPFPVAFWYEPTWFAVLDHRDQDLWLATTEPGEDDRLGDHLKLDLTLGDPQLNSSFAQDLPPNSSDSGDRPLTFVSDRTAYEAAVRQAQEHIRAGDIFQANLSLRFATTTPASGWQIYQTLHQINPSPFASYWHTPWGEVASCSPERLVQVSPQVSAQEAGQEVGQRAGQGADQGADQGAGSKPRWRADTRPIAGTRPRGDTPERDRQLAHDLLHHPKERAEHTMLVDLERNDLGRVCTWGSIVVDELLTIERYSHVMHLVSNVTGQLAGDRDAIDLIAAVFPGGTITGCPKVRCMEIIETLEPVRRNLFYGSLGYLDHRGSLDLNIAIRTLLLSPPQPDPASGVPLRQVWGQVGAGIVADSDPEREWEESLSKAAAQWTALQQTQTAAAPTSPP